MHIGLVSSTYPPIPGGVEVYVREVAHALHERGHDVTVATRFAEERPDGGMRGMLTTSAPSRQFVDEGVTVHVLGTGPLRQWLLAPTYRLHFYDVTLETALWLFERVYRPALEQALDACDVIHYSGTGRELLGFVAARVAADRDLPFVVTSHLHMDDWGDGVLDMRLYNQADRYIALTKREKEHVVGKGLSSDQISVIGHGVNVTGTGNRAAMRKRLEIEGPMVLYLGRKANYKGYPLLLEAMGHVWRQEPKTHFVLAGPDENGQTEVLRDEYADILADERVHELGFVSDEEREDLYAACDVFCLPSTAEAYGLVYLEAWRYGTPVVALRIPTLEELIGEVGGGLLTDKTPASVADALVHFITNPSEAQRMGKVGENQARRHSWRHVANRLTKVYSFETSAR
jgi:glycosyltransferase involved in cell wall biosynthesis